MKDSGHLIMGLNRLWCYDFMTSKKQSFGGWLWDGRPFEVLTRNNAKHIIYNVNNENVVISNPEIYEYHIAPHIKLLGNWTDQQWVNVDNPVPWAAAGFSPIETYDLLQLSENDPARPSLETLEMLATLRGNFFVPTWH